MVFSGKPAYHTTMSGMFKDTLFRSLFSEEKAFLSLYNAVSGANYGVDTQVVINTLSETLFSNRKNDVSGIIDHRLIVLTEQQSSINENMPFRCLSHIASLFENTVTDKTAVYRRGLVKLPRPVFIVLYAGAASYPDRITLKLSDAFKKVEDNDSVNLELMVEVINIGKGRNQGIVSQCESLKGYVEFVNMVRVTQVQLKEENPGMGREAVLERAIALSVTYCKRHDILRDFFENLSQEEVNMLSTEWNLEDALRVCEEETREKTRKEAREEARKETRKETREEDLDLILHLMNQARSMNELKKMVEESFSGKMKQSAPPPRQE
jgi:hypothetical protein